MGGELDEGPELREIPSLSADYPNAEEQLHDAKEEGTLMHRLAV
jgi:hypothetical protein